MQRLAIRDKTVRLERSNLERHAKHTQLNFWLRDLGQIQLVNENLNPGTTTADDRMIGKMIEMPVRKPQPDHLPSAFLGLLNERQHRAIGRVKNHRFFGVFIRD